jgi:multisubunit Na+/H+ antiporter MnhB subunit
MTGALARIGRNWRTLSSEQRLAAVAALALLLSMLLPWYDETVLNNGKLEHINKSAFGVYSFIEAAIFVVVVGVLVLLWARAERKAFHLPGGDGTVIMGAGLWVMFLIFYRQLDKPNGPDEGLVQTSIGVQWGIFIAFLLGALLAYAGYRIRASHVPEPLVDDAPPPPAGTVPAPAAADPPPDTEDTVVARRPPADDPFDGQLSFDEPAEYRPPPRG